MNTSELSRAIARQSNRTHHPLTIEQTHEALRLLVRIVTDEVAQGNRVKIQHLLTLQVTEKQTARPSVWYDTTNAPPKQKIRVRLSSILRERVRQQRG